MQERRRRDSSDSPTSCVTFNRRRSATLEVAQLLVGRGEFPFEPVELARLVLDLPRSLELLLQLLDALVERLDGLFSPAVHDGVKGTRWCRADAGTRTGFRGVASSFGLAPVSGPNVDRRFGSRPHVHGSPVRDDPLRVGVKSRTDDRCSGSVGELRVTRPGHEKLTSSCRFRSLRHPKKLFCLDCGVGQAEGSTGPRCFPE